MAEEAKVIETQPMVEVPRLSPFERLQAFLNEKGKIGAQTTSGTSNQGKELQYTRPYLYFITDLSFRPLGGFFGFEELKNYVDISISQKQPDSTDSPPSDIEITLAHRGQRKLGSPRGELPPAKQTSRIIVVNPSSERHEKAIINTYDSLGRLLNLSKKKWQEVRDNSSSYFVTSSEREAEKIVDVLVNMKEEEARIGKTTPEPLVSRRGFLRTLGAGAKLAALDTVLSHIPGTPSLSKDFWQQLETATMGIPPEEFKREIEKRFDIEVVGPSTGLREVEYSRENMIPTVDWDSPRLKMLIRTLSELPNHFYSPRKSEQVERKLQVALVDQPLVDFKALKINGLLDAFAVKNFCACSGSEEQPMVVLDIKSSGATFLESAFSREIIVHEFTHAVTTPEIEKYVATITALIGLDTLIELRRAFSSIIIVTKKGSPFVREYPENWTTLSNGLSDPTRKIVVDEKRLTFGDPHASPYTEKLGDNLYLYYKNLAEQKEVSRSRLIKINPEWYVVEEELNRYGEAFFQKEYQEYLAKVRDVEKYGGDIFAGSVPFVDITYLSYGATNFEEFFSVAATFYIRGHDRFVGTYEPFLGKERAEKLYNGVKQEIFRGVEY